MGKDRTLLQNCIVAYQSQKTIASGTAPIFIDLTATYDTVWHHGEL